MTVQAQSLVDVLRDGREQRLSEHPTWRALLHFEAGESRSSIITEDFFLSPRGAADPEAELVATLEAYFGARSTGHEAPIQCRFPARFLWLDRYLDLPPRSLDDCERLNGWALLDQTTSISLLLVSGYLGNPASTFGHSLVRLNSDSVDDRAGLFDLALNFGALVPENENPLVYVFRGLTGRYESGFSDRYYYTQDLVYSRTEFRDIWDYRLNLSEWQQRLLILHVWEILGRKFDYYFLLKNCGFRMAELLDMVVEEDLLEGAAPWYPPVELFHRLQDVDQARHERGQPPLVQSVRYLPSARRQLHHQLKVLTDDEMDALNEFAHTEETSVNEILSGRTQDRQMVLLDGLLAYQKYRLAADRPDSTHSAWARKDQILRARLALPAREPIKATIQRLASPAEGFRPANLTIQAGRVGEQDFGTVAWSPFEKESVGFNSLEGNELSFLDLSLAVEDASPAVYLDRFDAIRVLSLNPPGSRLRTEGNRSWQLRLGVDRERIGTSHLYEGTFAFGLGKAWRFGSRVIVFGMINAQMHTRSPLARARPELGFLVRLGSLHLQAGADAVSQDYEGDFQGGAYTRALHRWGRNHSVQVRYGYRHRHEVRIGVSRHY